MLAVFLVLTLVNSVDVRVNTSQASRIYQGAWFEITYPASFQARPSLRSSSAQGYDSAFFLAPDATVEFYVFSPQWNGEPTDIAPDAFNEVIVSQTTQRSGSKIIRRVTVKARDGRTEDTQGHSKTLKTQRRTLAASSGLSISARLHTTVTAKVI
jgi:hypothetical protein